MGHHLNQLQLATQLLEGSLRAIAIPCSIVRLQCLNSSVRIIAKSEEFRPIPIEELKNGILIFQGSIALRSPSHSLKFALSPPLEVTILHSRLQLGDRFPPMLGYIPHNCAKDGQDEPIVVFLDRQQANRFP
jgi:hypothetical protein